MTSAPVARAEAGARPAAPPEARPRFRDAVQRAGASAPRTRWEELALSAAVAAPLADAAPPRFALAGAATVTGPARAGDVARAAVATELVLDRERGALELRFGVDGTVRVEPAGSGVALLVDHAAHAAAAPLDPAALAGAVRARGVPVARAERRRSRSRGPGARPGSR